MAAKQLCFLSLAQLTEQIKARVLSPVEITQAYLDGIEAVDSKFNSYIMVAAEHALRETQAAEAEVTARTVRPPVHGTHRPVPTRDRVPCADALDWTIRGSALLVRDLRAAAALSGSKVMRVRSIGHVLPPRFLLQLVAFLFNIDL